MCTVKLTRHDTFKDIYYRSVTHHVFIHLTPVFSCLVFVFCFQYCITKKLRWMSYGLANTICYPCNHGLWLKNACRQCRCGDTKLCGKEMGQWRGSNPKIPSYAVRNIILLSVAQEQWILICAPRNTCFPPPKPSNGGLSKRTLQFIITICSHMEAVVLV